MVIFYGIEKAGYFTSRVMGLSEKGVYNVW